MPDDLPTMILVETRERRRVHHVGPLLSLGLTADEERRLARGEPVFTADGRRLIDVFAFIDANLPALHQVAA